MLSRWLALRRKSQQILIIWHSESIRIGISAGPRMAETRIGYRPRMVCTHHGTGVFER